MKSFLAQRVLAAVTAATVAKAPLQVARYKEVL
jgi:hypothetical protein